MSGILAHEALTELDSDLGLVRDFQAEHDDKPLDEFDALHDEVVSDQATEQLAEEAKTTETPSDAADTPPTDKSDDSESKPEGTDDEADAEDVEIDQQLKADQDTSSDEKKDTSEPSKDQATETEKASDSDKAAEAPKDEPVDGKQTTAVAESMRYNLEARMVTEDFKDALSATASAVGTGLATAGELAVDAVTGAARILGNLGMKYGPGIIDKVGRTLTYIFSRSVRLLLKTITVSIDCSRRQYRSFNSSLKKIASLKEAVAAIEQAQAEDTTGQPAVFRDEKVINYFRMGNSIDPGQSVKVLETFMNDAITQIDAHVSLDLQSIQRLIELTETGVKGDVLAFMQVKPFSGQYLKEQLPNYQQDTTLIDNYVYRQPLPNGLVFAAALPKANLSDLTQIGRAYQESGVFLAVDTSMRPLQQQSIDYMDSQNLIAFLDSLSALCRLALKHAELYGKIAKQSNRLKFGYRHYYQKLIESKEKLTIRESLVEYVHLKQAFISRVYLPAAMDIHDYIAAYVVRALSYAKENAHQLKRR